MQPIESIDMSAVQEKITLATNTVSNIVKTVEPDSPTELSVEAELRYTGQALDLRFDFDIGHSLGRSLESLRHCFVNQFRDLHGFVLEDIPVELVSFAITAKAISEPVPAPVRIANKSNCSPIKSNKRPAVRSVYDLDDDALVNYAVWSRDKLAVDTEVVGPAVVSEAQTTTLVRSGWIARKLDSGHLVLERSLS